MSTFTIKQNTLLYQCPYQAHNLVFLRDNIVKFENFFTILVVGVDSPLNKMFS